MVSVVQESSGCHGNKEEGRPAWVGVCVQEGFLVEMSLVLGVESQVHVFLPGGAGGGAPRNAGGGQSL